MPVCHGVRNDFKTAQANKVKQKLICDLKAKTKSHTFWLFLAGPHRKSPETFE